MIVKRMAHELFYRTRKQKLISRSYNKFRICLYTPIWNQSIMNSLSYLEANQTSLKEWKLYSYKRKLKVRPMKVMVLNVKIKPKAMHSYLGSRAYSFSLRLVRAKFNLRLLVLLMVVILNNLYPIRIRMSGFFPLSDHFQVKGFNVKLTYLYLRSINWL